MGALELPIKLTGRLDLGAAEALKADLMVALAAEGPPFVDAGELESIDTACLQLLCAFATELREVARPLRWLAVSPALQATARRLGLDKVLALEAEPAP
jgi:anti-anti-sigma regulatory factor